MISASIHTLIRADERAAQARLEAHPEQIDPHDGELMAWLAARSVPVIPAPWRGPFEAALDGPTRRLALHKLGATAWYEGRREEAEGYWTAAVLEGADHADALWGNALNNMSLVYSTGGRHFEALVATGLLLRAPRIDHPFLLAFARAFRARALLELGRPGDALQLLERAKAEARSPRTRELAPAAESIVLSAEIDLRLAYGAYDEALSACAQLLDRYDDHTPSAVRDTTRIKLLRTRFYMYEAERPAVLAELEALVERSETKGDWEQVERMELALLHWVAASRSGPSDAIERAAARVADLLDGALPTARAVEHMLSLLQLAPPSAPLCRRLKGQAADFVLERLGASQLDPASGVILSLADEEEWELLVEYQRCLLNASRSLHAQLAARWRPGLPAYDQLVGSGVVVCCAWCGQVRDRAGRWTVVADCMRLAEAQRMSHGICPSCARNGAAPRRSQ